MGNYRDQPDRSQADYPVKNKNPASSDGDARRLDKNARPSDV